MSDGMQQDAALSSSRQRRTQQNAESRGANLLPALIGFDELQLAIPGRVALQQGPPPLHQPADSVRYSRPARPAFFSERQTVSYSLVSGKGSSPVVGQRPRLVDYRPWWSNVVESVPEGAPSWDELNESAKEKREAA